MDNTPRVAVWAAVSSKPQAGEDKVSLREQERLGREYAANVAGEVVAVYKVHGHSRDIVFWHEAEGEMGAYRDLRQDCEARAFDVLWCLDPDRLGRDNALSTQVVSLVTKAGASVHFGLGDYTVDGAGGAEYLFAIGAVRGKEDSRRRKYNHAMGMRGRAKRGLHSGTPPLGYRAITDAHGATVGYEVVEHEAACIAEMTKMYLSGVGIPTMRNTLSRSRWPVHPRTGKRWRMTTIQRYMHKDIYAGYVSYAEIKTRSPLIPLLWDEETHRAVIRERQRRYRGGKPYASPCSGFVFCSACGWRMVVSGRRKWFRCAKRAKFGTDECEPNRVRVATVESAVVAEIKKYTGEYEVRAMLSANAPDPAALTADVAQAAASVERLQAALVALNVDHAKGRISTTEHTAARLALLGEITAAEQARQEAQQMLDCVPGVEERVVAFLAIHEAVNEPGGIHALPVPEMRALLAVCGLHIRVKRGVIESIAFEAV